MSAPVPSSKSRRSWASVIVLWFGLLAMTCSSCDRRTLATNVILITIDTLRPDRLSAYGYDGHVTTNFDRLAREGMLFEKAFVDVTWTTPSMASVMTGRYAPHHGLRSSNQRLGSEAQTIAEQLHGQGVATAAIVASYPLDSIYGLDQGFDLYDDTFSLPVEPAAGTGSPVGADAQHAPPTPLVDQAAKSREDRKALETIARRRTDSQRETGAFMAAKAKNDAYRPDRELSDRAIEWLRAAPRKPFFLWLHYFGPHEKPQPGDSYAEWVRIWREQYDPDVLETDRQLGRLLDLLDELGLADQTAIILHADHAQSLTEHGYFGHGMNVYDATQHIPLLMRLPGKLRAGERVGRIVQNVDVFPTILALMGIDYSGPMDGRSLLSASEDKAAADEIAYVETYLPASLLFGEIRNADGKVELGYRKLGVRTPKWKFVVNDPSPLSDVDDSPEVTQEIRAKFYSEELYDLEADPGETTNVIRSHRDVASRLLAEVGRRQSIAPVASEDFRLDDASRDRLRSLGYIQ